MRKWLAYTIPIGSYKKTYLLIAAAILTVTAAGCGPSTTNTTSSTTSNNTGSSGSGPTALWVANQTGPSVTSYATSDLSAGGSISPAATITSSSIVDPFCSAFDSKGNLWVVDRVGSKQPSKIEEFTASNVASGGNLTPAVTIAGSNTTLLGGAGCAFDSSGNFWVADDDGSPNSVVAFSPTQLATGGDIAPTIELTSSEICNPIGLTFDKNGNLWVANLCFDNVVEFKSGDLAASGSVSPTIQISNISQPYGLIFDTSGNLWVTSELGNSVDEFQASDLTPGTSITPHVVISGSNTMLDQPIGLAFDTNGNLWVAQQNSNTLVMYSASNIAASGNPAPSTTVLGTNTGLASPANILFH